MDHESIHGKGESNFASPLSHRLPTISAAQALQDLKSSPTRCISTGLDHLDAVLQNREPFLTDGEPSFGGVSRGKVTEIYGPPGVGKTALSMQLAASALRAGEGVVWVDTSHPLCGTRFFEVLTASSPKIAQPKEISSPMDLLERIIHLTTPTLAHLIALLSDPAPTYTTNNISLIVIDAFSTLISTAFPRSTEPAASKKAGAPNSSTRKFSILQYIINALQKIAATQNVAVVVISQCVTKMRPGAGAVLIPSVNTPAWEQGLGCRIALYRDWGWDDQDGKPVNNVRFAQVIKAEGINLPEGRVKPAGFAIDQVCYMLREFSKTNKQQEGLKSLKLPVSVELGLLRGTASLINRETSTSVLPQKRKFPPADLVIPDSEDEDDEDYGWAEEDEHELPPPPSQWQGSEDILLIPPVSHYEAEEEGEEEEEEENLDDELHGKSNEQQVDEVPALKKTKLNHTHTIQHQEIEDSEDELA